MARRRDYTMVQPSGDPTTDVSKIYEGRETAGYPRNKEPLRRRDPASNLDAKFEPPLERTKDRAYNINTVQDPVSSHDVHYDNDATGWVRGCRSGEPTCHNESAEHKPFFDKRTYGGATN